MLRTLAGSFVFSFYSLYLTACGGDANADGAGACSIKGCGGDIKGTWAVKSLCAHSPAPPSTGVSACDAVAKDAVNSTRFESMDMQIVFTDTDYTQSGSVKADFTYVYTEACLGAQSGLAPSDETCAEVEKNLNGAGQDGTCRFSANTCVCDMSKVFPVSETGTYSVEGTNLVTDGTKAPFCVHGNTAEFANSNSMFSGSMSLERR